MNIFLLKIQIVYSLDSHDKFVKINLEIMAY